MKRAVLSLDMTVHESIKKIKGWSMLRSSFSQSLNGLPFYLRGVGKTTIARLIAKGVNCLNSEDVTDNPCGECENCREISQGISMDMIEIDAASNRGIDEIRELKEKINYQPIKGRKKIYIIDEVHMLTKEA